MLLERLDEGLTVPIKPEAETEKSSGCVRMKSSSMITIQKFISQQKDCNLKNCSFLATETPLLLHIILNISGNVFQSLTSRLRRAVVEALDWMDPDLVQTPRDSPAFQQATAPDFKHVTFLLVLKLSIDLL